MLFPALQYILPFNIKPKFWSNIRKIISVVCVKIGMHDLYRIGSIYSGSTAAMVWLLMTWFLVSLGHQQPWQWKWELCRSLTTAKKDFDSLRYFSALENGVHFSKYIKIIRYAKGQILILSISIVNMNWLLLYNSNLCVSISFCKIQIYLYFPSLLNSEMAKMIKCFLA